MTEKNLNSIFGLDIVKSAILNLGELEVEPKKKYIAFVSGSNVVDIHIQKSALKMWLNLQQGDLDDPKGIARYVSSVGHWVNGDYVFFIRTDEDLEYNLNLIKQSFKKNKKQCWRITRRCNGRQKAAAGPYG